MTLLDELVSEARRPRGPREARVVLLRAAAAHVAVNSDEVTTVLRELGIEPVVAGPGDPILVAASTVGSLWRLARDGDLDITPLRDDGARAWSCAQRVAARYLPVLAGDVDRRHAPRGVVPLGAVTERAVQGPSFGASFLLAHASRWMGIPVDDDLAASAEVADDGSIKRVDWIDLKIAALRDHAPGVRRLILEKEQAYSLAEDTRRVLANAGIEIVPVTSALEVIEAGFTRREHGSWLRARWAADPSHAGRLALHLFREIVHGRQAFTNWLAVGTTARLIAAVPGISEEEAWEATVVRVIAERHGGTGAEPLPRAPASRRLPRGLLLELRAHELQAANDRCDPNWEPVVRDALADLALEDGYAEDLMVVGAAGRCLAGWGRWDEAGRWLRLAVEGWYARDEHHLASYAAGELVRVVGLGGSTEALTAAVHLAQLFVTDPRTSEMSRAYFALAEGRAWATLGDAGRAIEALVQAPAGALLDNRGLAACIGRWKRVALRALGGAVDAAEMALVRADATAGVLVRIEDGELEAEGDFGAADAREWARCQELGGGVEQWLRGFPY